MKRNAIYKQYTCSKCGKVYTSARCYRDSAGEVVCLDCKREDDHSLGKSKTFTSKTYTCSHCGKIVTSMKVYRDKSGNPVCYECKKSEDSTYRSPELKTYTCFHCGKTVESRNVHRDEHGQPVCFDCKSSYTCTKCGTEYHNSHPIYNSLGEVVCLECKRLEDPTYGVQQSKTYTCSNCGKTFTSKKTLRYEGQVVCPDCMRFLNPSFGVKEEKNHVCSVCGKEFSSKFTYYLDGKVVCLECKQKADPSFFQHPVDQEKVRASRNSTERVQAIISEQSARFDCLGTYLNEESETVFKFRCKQCGTEFEKDIRDLQLGKYVCCSNEKCSAGHSKSEIDLRNYVRYLLKDDSISSIKGLIRNDRGNPVELDIYIPSRKLAIEYDGLYWHKDVNNSYKFDECKKLGIRLIQIFDFEWCGESHELVESYLRSTFGIFEHKVGARTCEIRPVTSPDYKDFVINNHLQGYIPASVRLGLYYKDELVQLVSFGKSRFDDSEWELLRECSKKGWKILGGKEKLIKNFIDTYKPKSLISYCDKSKFSGNSYLKCGFVLDSCTPWNYCYVKYDCGMKVLNRVSAQKFKLKKLLGADNFDPSLTASQNMSNNGWTRFTTLGTYKFVYRG